MSDARSIRGNVILEYAEQYKRIIEFGSELTWERNKLHSALNKEFGYSGHDGSFSNARMSHVDQEYMRQYDEIESRFREQKKDHNLPVFDDWCRSLGMTIFEFLFFDDIVPTHLREIAADVEKGGDLELWPIEAKARLWVHWRSADHYVGEVRSQLDALIGTQQFANSRCRKFFALKPWDLSSQKAILDYTREWKEALNRAFDGVKVSLAHP
jgi:hypothetical protein